MKKLIALALVLAALLGLAAHAESKASIVRMSDLALSYVGSKGTRSVRFDDAYLTLAMGDSQGAPTVQLSFENSNGQAVDGVAQIAGHNILLSVGGISGVYVMDLGRFVAEGSTVDELAGGLSKTLSLAGAHLDVVLYAITAPEADGSRSVQVPLPMPQLIGAAEAILDSAGNVQGSEDMNLEALSQRMDTMNGEAMLEFSYNPQTGAFELEAIQDGRGMRLSGTMEMRFEPMTFIDVNAEEERIDVMNITPEQLDRFKGELGMVMAKFSDFAEGTGLDGIMP